MKRPPRIPRAIQTKVNSIWSMNEALYEAPEIVSDTPRPSKASPKATSIIGMASPEPVAAKAATTSISFSPPEANW